jgi:hypothetical protein
MANKPFAIQGADLTLGGVNLQAGTTGVVIPGVTRATSYVPEEVEDVDDQTHAFNSPPVVIDHTYYSILNGDYSPSGYTEAEYVVTELDGDDFIDGIDIVSQGSGWDLTSANAAKNNDMWAYTGSEQNPFASFVNTDWIQIPFRIKIRAGEIETIGGGGGGSSITNEGETLSIRTDGEVILDGPEGGVDRGVRWKYGSDNGGVDSFIRQDEGGLTIQSYADDQNVNGTNIKLRTGDTDNYWTFQPNGALRFPDGTTQTTASGGLNPIVTKVDGQALVKGVLKFGQASGVSISEFDSDASTAVWFNSATGDLDGNKYAVGNDDYGDAFLNKYNPDGTLEWSFEFDDIDFGNGNQQVNPFNVKLWGSGPQYIYVGFDIGSFCGAVKFDLTGSVQATWIYTVADPDNTSIDHHALEIDADGNPILVGRQYGAWESFNTITPRAGSGMATLVVNQSDLSGVTDVYSDTGSWRVDTNGSGNWYNPEAINRIGPVPVTTITGVGGAHSIVETTDYSAGAFVLNNTNSPVARLQITVADWTDTAELNAITAHTAGQFTYEFVCAPGSRYSFTTSTGWTLDTGVWYVDGSFSILSGDSIGATTANVTSLAYGTTTEVYVWYTTNNDKISTYSYFDMHTTGTGYADGDIVKIPGSLLLGVNGSRLNSGTTYVPVTYDNALTCRFAQFDYPTLDSDIPVGTLARFNNNNIGQVVSITDTGLGGWDVLFTMVSAGAPTNGEMTFYVGNDALGVIQSGGGYVAYTDGLPVQGKVVFGMSQSVDFRGVENTTTYVNGTDYQNFEISRGADAIVVKATLTAIVALLQPGHVLTNIDGLGETLTIIGAGVDNGEGFLIYPTSGTVTVSIGTDIGQFTMGNGTFPATTWNIGRSLQNEGFIITNSWSQTVGGLQGQQFIAASLDPVNNILYASGDFNINNYGDTIIMAFDMADGSILWQKAIDEPTGWNRLQGIVADSINGCVYAPIEDDDGNTTVLKISKEGVLIWSSKDSGSNNWNNPPAIVLDSNQDPILVGSMNMYQWDPDNWHNELAFVKLSKTDGSFVWANAVVRIGYLVDIYEYYDTDTSPVNIVNDVIYWGGYTYDYNNNYNTGLTVALPADGTSLGSYGDWLYHEILPGTADPGQNGVDFNFNNVDFAITLVSQSYITSTDFAMTLDENYSISGTQMWPNWMTRATLIGGITKLEFNDGSFFDQPGIGRHAVDGGEGQTWLTAEMNGKFIYFNDNQFNYSSSLYIAPNSQTPLPIGYTLTVVMGNFATSVVYVNSAYYGNAVSILASGSDNFNNTAWTFGGDGKAGVYTIMKVDTDTWMLAGPNVQVD